MKIAISSDQSMQLSDLYDETCDVEKQDPASRFGGIAMCVASLAKCTYITLRAYSKRIECGADDITIDLHWEVASDHNRIQSIDMQIHWPELPDSRLKAASRAAMQCTVHQTLKDTVSISVSIDN